jgi:hypothetical protein
LGSLTAVEQFESLIFVKGAAILLAAAFTAGIARGDQFLPTATGTTWKYQLIQEFGKGVQPGADENVQLDADGKLRLPVSTFVAGTENIDGVETIKYEMRRQGRVQLTEFLKVDEHGVTAWARSAEDGEKSKVDPPQKILSFPPRAGEKWEFKGRVGGEETEQAFEMLGQEKVQVPAGRFEAYHLRLTQLSPTPPKVIEDRWFVPRVGYVKIVTEVKRGDDQLLQRINLELTETPKMGERPIASSTPAEKKPLEAALAKELTGEPTTEFATDTPKIYARWQGETLQNGDKIRCVWIAEDVGDVAPKNYKVNETSTTAGGPRASGTFSLSKPNAGWPVGKYRAEFYKGDQLVETVKFEIVK